MEIAKTLYFFAGIQGIILSLILLFSKKHGKTKANKFLAVFLFLFSFNILRNYFSGYHFNSVKNYPIIYLTTWSFVSFFGPFFYLYVKSLAGLDIHLSKTIKKHFIIPIIYFFFLFYAGIKGIVTDEQASKLFIERYIYLAFQVFIVFQLLAYLILSLRIIWKYHKRLHNQFSNIDKLKLNWLFQFTLGLLIIYILWIALMGGDLLIFKENIAISDYVINLFWAISAIYVYWIGYYALLKPEIFIKLNSSRLKTNSSNILLNDQEIKEYKLKLIELLEKEKVFLNGSLTVNQLAKKLKTSSKITSQVINIGFEKTFYDLINYYRIEEVKLNLLDASYANYTLEAIALSSGFKSSTTFNRLFKSYTKQTPNQYRNTHLK
ncbi:helix-turn-helix domain-containing protein [Pontimicrobium sp. SW4]|uniref:Helix-turn-helix domain-containing protein n=1 Tax=Pontimicrobium sp. SW4 TaxID=3153519 RepID=A0AAU7BWM5_9FLAO